jgi:aminopeptidase N
VTAKTKTDFFSLCTFAIFFVIGWKFGISPLKESFETASSNIKFVKQQLLGLPQVNTPSNYISENQYNTDILHYDLSFDLYPEKKLLVGKAKIIGTFKDSHLPKLDLNLYDNMKISYLTLNGEKVSYLHEGTRLSILFEDLAIDTFVVDIHYEGTPKRMGLSSFVFGEINGRAVIYNLSEPTFASTWYPCNDIPDDKALADIHITNDSIYTSVSNWILIDEEIIKGRKTANWKILYPISTYLICIYSSKYVSFKDYYYSNITKDSLPLEYNVFAEHLNNAKKDFEEHPQMMEFFADTFGEYPFMKEKYGVTEFLWQLGAMEHQTITGIGSNFVSGRKFFNDIYVHELAHHWWGNAVGLKTWKDIWLNEGFATYSEALYDEYKGGSDALKSTMLSKYNDNFTGRLYDPGDNLFNQTVYDKGAWVLHMLRWEAGDSTFFIILRNYFEEYKYKSASTSDFKNICEEISGKDFTKFFDQWVYEGDDQIKMNIDWKIESTKNNTVTVQIDFKQLQDRYKEFHFPVELHFISKNEKYENAIFYINEREKVLFQELKFEPDTVIADPDSWLLADIKVARK